MIDCNKIENYFAEKQRMTKKTENGFCCEDCTSCPLSINNNGSNVSCRIFELYYPKEASKIVQKWSDEHPLKTYLSEFLKHYPNTLLNDAGLPKDVCLYNLGLTGCRNDCNCIECWNQPIKDKSEIK
jgi:hypothetical protein